MFKIIIVVVLGATGLFLLSRKNNLTDVSPFLTFLVVLMFIAATISLFIK